MERIDFLKVPYNYPICLNHECIRAVNCLRQLAEQSVPEDVQFWNIISPKHLATLKGTCPYYRSSAKVRYTKGFIQILENLPHKQMQSVIYHLMGLFGRRTYYRVRKGERLLSPPEQQQFLNILEKCGVTSFREFDAYVEDYDW